MYGGLGRAVHALSHALAGAGHDVRVLTHGRGVAGGDGAPTPGTPHVHRVPLPAEVPDVHLDTAGFVVGLHQALVAGAAQVLRDWQPDVVHGHDWVVAEASTAIAHETGAPLVMTLHATEYGLWGGWLTSDFSRWRASIERDLVRSADRTVVCSQAMRGEALDGLHAQADRVVVIPNGVEPERWTSSPEHQQAARRAAGVPDDVPMLVLVGRLEYEKGGQDAIAALALLPDPRAHLVLVGSGSQREALAEQAARDGVADRVHLVGRLDDRTSAALLGAADVALVPSRYEPFGLVALEAMAAGTPVVVARSGGLADIVRPGETGLVVPPAAPGALAQAVSAVLCDPTASQAMVRRAQDDAGQRFSWDAVARATGDLYSSVRAARAVR
jgi:glycogen(starch) synthase